MKLSTIPKRTSENGLYRVDYSMKYLSRSIKDMVDDYGLDLNPDFQRGHVWTEEQQTSYIEFLLTGGRADHIKFNDVSLNTSNNTVDFVIVDGLQRLTAMLKFMDNDLPVFGGHTLDDIEDVSKYIGRIYIPIMINNLQTRKEVLKWYLEINSGGTPHTKEEIKRVEDLYNKEL